MRHFYTNIYVAQLVYNPALYAAKTSIYVHIYQRNVIGNMWTKPKRDILR